jgi:hypothetical protein
MIPYYIAFDCGGVKLYSYFEIRGPLTAGWLAACIGTFAESHGLDKMRLIPVCIFRLCDDDETLTPGASSD